MKVFNIESELFDFGFTKKEVLKLRKCLKLGPITYIEALEAIRIQFLAAVVIELVLVAISFFEIRSDPELLWPYVIGTIWISSVLFLMIPMRLGLRAFLFLLVR